MLQSSLFASCFFVFFSLCQSAHQLDDGTKTYIIHVDHSLKPQSVQSHEQWHRSLLTSLSNPVPDHNFLYSYSTAMNGFSARLTPSQLLEFQNDPAHLVTHEDSYGRLLTTYSPKFLGLDHKYGLWHAASQGKGSMIGVFDTGVWPESQSFSEEGMPPVPRRWKGRCQNDTIQPFRCNRKLIGAQVFLKGIQPQFAVAKSGDNPDLHSPRDYFFHGTHTSSIAVGNYVPGASDLGFASGTARGVAPRAHLAMYKVGTRDSIAKSDVLAAMDQALLDGVDVMSLSFGFNPVPFFNDSIAIASLSAIEKGVSVVCAAGNYYEANTTVNGAPWINTVGAGTLDRITFAGELTLGDGSVYKASSKYPLSVYISNATLIYESNCKYGSLNQKDVAGRVIVCLNENSDKITFQSQVLELERVDAYAAIVIANSKLMNDFLGDLPIPILVLPHSHVIEYAKRSNPYVQSMRFVISTLDTKPAPRVADYSSRGPNLVHPGILKPDLIAPGSDILAAVPPFPIGDKLGKYNLVSDYSSFSGTSMATPHVAGVVALLKTAHPEWSPAGIRSAMMTTAYNMDNNGSIITDESTGLPATPLDFGAGHVDPNKALDPGLVYDIGFQDYVDFICGLGYNQEQMKALVRRSKWDCTKPNLDINYPSFVAIFRNGSWSAQKFRRVLTNVGHGASTYQAVVVNPDGMRIKAQPRTLVFSEKSQTRDFVLSVEKVGQVHHQAVHGQLKWVDEHHHVVSSPVVALSF